MTGIIVCLLTSHSTTEGHPTNFFMCPKSANITIKRMERAAINNVYFHILLSKDSIIPISIKQTSVNSF
jgi:hypothetical protein